MQSDFAIEITHLLLISWLIDHKGKKKGSHFSYLESFLVLWHIKRTSFLREKKRKFQNFIIIFLFLPFKKKSCSNSIEAEHIVEKSSTDPKGSLLVGCLSQIKFYKNRSVRYNALNSPIVKQLLDVTKSKMNAFKFLSVNANLFNVTKDLPLNYTFLVLQHNPAK